MIRSLCETCESVREVRTARSRFLLYGLSLTAPADPKYPAQGTMPTKPNRVIGAKPVDGRDDPRKVRHANASVVP